MKTGWLNFTRRDREIYAELAEAGTLAELSKALQMSPSVLRRKINWFRELGLVRAWGRNGKVYIYQAAYEKLPKSLEDWTANHKITMCEHCNGTGFIKFDQDGDSLDSLLDFNKADSYDESV